MLFGIRASSNYGSNFYVVEADDEIQALRMTHHVLDQAGYADEYELEIENLSDMVALQYGGFAELTNT